jgi:hypothetical protein
VCDIFKEEGGSFSPAGLGKALESNVRGSMLLWGLGGVLEQGCVGEGRRIR